VTLVRFVRRLIVGVILIYVGNSFLLGGTTAAKPVLRVLVATWLVALIWYSRRRRYPTPRIVDVGEVVVSNVAFILLFSELTLRTYAACSGDLYWVAGTLDAHRLIPGHDYGGGLRGNGMGYPSRDFERRKRKEVYRIAALGDSFAVGCTVPFQANFLTQLEGNLDNAEVLNFGVSGAGPREYLSILNCDAVTFAPDLVLVHVFVGNDITEMLPTPRSLDVRGHALWQFGRRSLRLLEEQRRRHGDAVTSLPVPPALSEQTFREVQARRLEVCLHPVSSAMEKKWLRCFAYLDAIVESCRQRSLPLAFVLIPDELQTNPAVLEQALRDRDVSASRVDLDLPQRRLSQWCSRHSLPCLDLKPIFVAYPAGYAPRDTHWSVAGHRRAGNALAAWLKSLR